MSGTVNSAGRPITSQTPHDNRLPRAGLEDRLRGLEFALSLETVGITVFDSLGRLVFANPAFSSIYGIGGNEELSELSLQGVVGVLAPACGGEIEALKCLVPSRFHTQGLMPESVRATLSSEKIVQISHHLGADGGWVTRHLTVCELSGQRQFNNELVSLQALIDQLPDYLWVKDTQSRFVVANLALAMDSGRIKSSDMIGLTDFDVHTAERAAQFHARELEILRSGAPMLDAEEAIIDTNGQEKWFSSSKIPLRNDSGDIVGLIGVARDITARRSAEELRTRAYELEENSRQLTSALEQERHANELQRQFVAMASHEFRTPLAIIDGAAQRLLRRKEELSATFVEEKSQQIRQAVSRIVELMESILSFGALDAGNAGNTPENFSLRQLLSACCQRQQGLSTRHRIVSDLVSLPDTIVADRSALDQVFTNLLSNAVKYSPYSPKIIVRGWCEGRTVRVSVQDYGIGIDPDDLPKMFARYFRARTSTGIAGTGIGLNLVKHIVELHGGRVGVESKRGEGSTFTVSLPIAEQVQVSTSLT
jgi:PAS domain S-box-containing protein